VVTMSHERFGTAASFTSATLAALAIHRCSLALTRRRRAI